MDEQWGSVGLWQGGKKLFVVTGDDCGHIRHTAMAYYCTVFSAYLMEPMMFKKTLRD